MPCAVLSYVNVRARVCVCACVDLNLKKLKLIYSFRIGNFLNSPSAPKYKPNPCTACKGNRVKKFPGGNIRPSLGGELAAEMELGAISL